MIYSFFSLLAFSIGINTSAFAQEVWSIWVDPHQYSLKYPLSWYIDYRTNRFQDQDLLFNIDANWTRLSINAYNTTSTDIREIMEQGIRDYQMSTTPVTPSLFAGPDYTTYTVSGKPAASAIWLHDIPGVARGVTQNFVSIVGGKFVGIIYTSSAQDFDKYFPDVEKLIQSIKVKS